MPGTPLYPFGYGLSYTHFEYSNLRVEPAEIHPGGEARVTVDVKNAGDRAGVETVQLYIHEKYAPVSTPVKQLRGFERVALESGRNQNRNPEAYPGGSPVARYRHALAGGAGRFRDHGGKVVGGYSAARIAEGDAVAAQYCSLRRGPRKIRPDCGPSPPWTAAAAQGLEFLHFVSELPPGQAPDSRRVTEEQFGDITAKCRKIGREQQLRHRKYRPPASLSHRYRIFDYRSCPHWTGYNERACAMMVAEQF